MKYFELDKEEQKLLDEVEKGEWISVRNLARAKNAAIRAARNTLNKTRNINIRLSERDLQKVRARAVEEGIPYQTLVASVVHKYAAR